jgi:hypothetical protein
LKDPSKPGSLRRPARHRLLRKYIGRCYKHRPHWRKGPATTKNHCSNSTSGRNPGHTTTSYCRTTWTRNNGRSNVRYVDPQRRYTVMLGPSWLLRTIPGSTRWNSPRVRINQVLEKLSGLPRIRSSGGRKLKSRETVSKIGREKKKKKGRGGKKAFDTNRWFLSTNPRQTQSSPPSPILYFFFFICIFPSIGNSRSVSDDPHTG